MSLNFSEAFTDDEIQDSHDDSSDSHHNQYAVRGIHEEGDNWGEQYDNEIAESDLFKEQDKNEAKNEYGNHRDRSEEHDESGIVEDTSAALEIVSNGQCMTEDHEETEDKEGYIAGQDIFGEVEIGVNMSEDIEVDKDFGDINHAGQDTEGFTDMAIDIFSIGIAGSDLVYIEVSEGFSEHSGSGEAA